ncbi:dipeptidase [Nocardioides sp.]|uniref:dipeptidase n=1 Tax=Nocardioides sp. TaxID=35761 RepID=UPI002CF229E4|nr:dipeptidase [Nocardioides sp.]HXH80894.1 dipeptidase [Nocardioides sp.]
MDLTALLAGSPVIDGHNDLLWTARVATGYDFERLDVGTDLSADLTTGSTPTHTDLPRMRVGGVGAQFWSVYVPTRLTGDDAVSATLEQVDAAYNLTQRHPDQLAMARTADDVEAAWANGRMASLMGAEGGHSINCSLGTLRQLHALGVRYLTLTHNANTPWADSATDAPVAGGLTRFGREVVREMNRLGMMVDLSHVSADTMRDALAVTEVPAIFSHSSARAVTDSPRNAPDDVLESLRDQGGICMVTFVPRFVNQACADWHRSALEAASVEGITEADGARFTPFYESYRAAHPEPPADLTDVVAHCEHVREVAGIDHVGLGGDYDGVEMLPRGLEDVSRYPALLGALAEAGWSESDLARLTCRNILRVMRAVENGAREIQQRRGPSLARMEDLDG